MSLDSNQELCLWLVGHVKARKQTFEYLHQILLLSEISIIILLFLAGEQRQITPLCKQDEFVHTEYCSTSNKNLITAKIIELRLLSCKIPVSNS